MATTDTSGKNTIRTIMCTLKRFRSSHMNRESSSYLPTIENIWYSQIWSQLPESARLLFRLLMVAAFLTAGTLIVYFTGGTKYAYPYMVLLPVLLSAIWFGFSGAILCAITGGLLLGPLMPLEVATGTYQSTDNWVALMRSPRLCAVTPPGTTDETAIHALSYLLRRS